MLKNPRFLYPKNPAVGDVLSLDEEQSAHCARVLRINTGETISIIDGQGGIGEGKVIEALPKRVKIILDSWQKTDRKSKVQIVFGLTKPQALEWIFKKCTEIGVHSFQPIITDHSLHPSAWNRERWNKIVVEACKQSQELWFPEIFSPISFRQWLDQKKPNESFVFCDEDMRSQPSPILEPFPSQILIGPEGGWSQQEREIIRSTTFQYLALGPNRLRAETACLVALALVKSIQGEL
jgi:16S rRNA (uracil1498-N3)-methyltransferase